MDFPAAFLHRMEAQLGEEYEAFVSALTIDPSISLRTNPRKMQAAPALSSVPWARDAYYLPERPVFTFDPLWHAGAYYVQEASSMLVEQALRQHVDLDQSLRVLDLCAAPGGKSTHLQSLISQQSLLLSNEVIRSRARILRENMIRWGAPNVIVTNNDPDDFAALPGFFDLIVVDAPCSGEGLFRKDASAIEQWNSTNLQICVDRQRRILASIWESLKPGGLLVYSTCTYHPAENEENLVWLRQRTDFENLTLDLSSDWGFRTVEAAGITGYQALPHRVRGEGFFLALLRKTSGSTEEPASVRKPKLERLSRRDREGLAPWLSTENVQWGQLEDKVFAFPETQAEVWESIYDRMSVVSGGLLVAERKKKGFVPSHRLAMSQWLRKEAFSEGALSQEEALHYLKRDPLNTRFDNGWVLTTFEDIPLGWLKQIGHRSNNYYPQEWRIKMDLAPDKFWTIGS